MFNQMRQRGICLAAVAIALMLAPASTTLFGQTADLDDSAPTGPGLNSCGTLLTPEQAEVAAYLESIGTYDPPAGLPRFLMQVPVTIHIVRLDNGTGGLTSQQADDALAAANALWEPAGLQFFRPLSVRFINNTSLFNVDNEAELVALWSTDVIQDSVNVYFVNQLASFDGGSFCGIASFSYVPVQGIAVANGCTPSGGNTTTFAHELGHYFDLYHTHETAVGVECPDGSNCATAGDLVCDTPADPNLAGAGQLSGCSYSGSGTACGDPYNPDTRNVMSYAGACRSQFSYLQAVRAATTLFNVRTNLVIAGGNPTVTWVEFGAPAGGNGTHGNPYNSLAEGVAHVAPGGRVVIKRGSSGETITLTEPVTLDAFQGSAVIGS